MSGAVDLVISGGSIEGICDAVGFIKAITVDLGLSIASAAGASAGGVILGIYAAGNNISDIEKLVLDIDFSQWISVPSWWNVFKICRALRNGWLSDGSELEQYLANVTSNKLMKDSRIDLHIAGTDICNSQLHDFNKINDPNISLALAMRITCCVPGCFKPPLYDGTLWGDGSIRSHYPAELIPTSSRPFYGFLATHFIKKNEQMRNMEGIYGTISRIIDNTIDVNVRYSESIASRKPITVYHSGPSYHSWKLSKQQRKEMIENARITTVNRIKNGY